MKNALALDEALSMIEASPRVSGSMSLVKSPWKQDDSTQTVQPRIQAKKKPLDNAHFNWPPCSC
jgi:hypothetical protein